MKRIWLLFILLCSTAVFLMACRDNQGTETLVPVETPATAVAKPTAVATASNTNDLTNIGQTGRPQLLNAYASW